MILIEKTVTEFGYDPTDWVPQRNKVWCNCDYCKKNYITKGGTLHMAIKKNPNFNKFACKKCKGLKRVELEKLNGIFDLNMEKRIATRKESLIKKYGSYEKYCEWLSSINKDRWVNLPEEDKIEKMKYLNKGLDKFLNENNVTSALKLDWVKDKAAETSIKNYGETRAYKNKDFMEKILIAREEKYGTRLLYDIPGAKQKAKISYEKTMMEKYGVPHNMMTQESIDKSRQTLLRNGNCHNWNGKTGRQWQLEKGVDYRTLKPIYDNFGEKGLIDYKKNRTGIEHLIGTILEKNNLWYYPQFKVEKQFADFLIPEHKLIIEADGIFYHTEKFYPFDYHVEKQKLYCSNGFDSLFFREDEIEDKLDVVESYILKRVGLIAPQIIKNPIIKEISFEELLKFNDDNSLNRLVISDINLGLFDSDKLISVAGFQLIDNQWVCKTIIEQKDIIVNVHSLLFEEFKKSTNAQSINIYLNNRFENIKMFENLGFEFVDFVFSYELTNTNKVINREKACNSNMNEDELLAGTWARLFDCGQTLMRK